MGRFVLLSLLGLILVAFLSGCLGQKADEQATPKERAISACMQKCRDALNAGQDLSNGPCLDNNIVEGWVCDVAHSPRISTDDSSVNQCTEFGKTAYSFVEVDPGCNFIKAESMT
jgi:hypothetical protein